MVHILYNYRQFLSNYAESTKETYLTAVNQYLKYLRKINKKPKEVSKIDIYNYIAYMDNLSYGRIKNRLLAVKNYYLFLNRNLSEDLFQDIKLFNLNKKLPYYLFSWQIDILKNYYQDKRNYLIIFLFLNTGIRISELANIQIENINLKEKYIYLKVKGGWWRNVYLNQKCTKLLKEYIGRRKKGSLFNLKRRSIDYIVKKPMKEYGIKGSAHTLRHTFATVMYKKTHDILLVKELLGHKSITSTEIYAHLDNELIRQAVNSNPLANYEVGGRK